MFFSYGCKSLPLQSTKHFLLGMTILALGCFGGCGQGQAPLGHATTEQEVVTAARDKSLSCKEWWSVAMKRGRVVMTAQINDPKATESAKKVLRSIMNMDPDTQFKNMGEEVCESDRKARARETPADIAQAEEALKGYQ